MAGEAEGKTDSAEILTQKLSIRVKPRPQSASENYAIRQMKLRNRRSKVTHLDK